MRELPPEELEQIQRSSEAFVVAVNQGLIAACAIVALVAMLFDMTRPA